MARTPDKIPDPSRRNEEVFWYVEVPTRLLNLCDVKRVKLGIKKRRAVEMMMELFLKDETIKKPDPRAKGAQKRYSGKGGLSRFLHDV